MNAGLTTHVAALRVDGSANHLSIHAEDGNVYPDPKEQASVTLPAGQTKGALVTAAGTGDIVIYDRALDLTNAGAPDGGMIVRLPLELFTGAAAVAHASTLAVDDAYTVAEGVVGHSEPLGTGVLANDDGSITGAVQIVGVGAFASDAGGTVTLASDGSFAYDAPAGDFTGEDSWQYLGTPGGNVATVTIDVTNTPDAPVALDDARSVFEGEAVNVGVLGNDHDPDGDALTVTLTAPLVAGVVVNAADQSVSFTAPGASFSFTYEVSDGALTSGMATVSIDVTAAGGPTLSVVDGGTGVAIAGGFRWVVEEDVGFHPVPNVRDLDILSEGPGHPVLQLSQELHARGGVGRRGCPSHPRLRHRYRP